MSFPRLAWTVNRVLRRNTFLFVRVELENATHVWRLPGT